MVPGAGYQKLNFQENEKYLTILGNIMNCPTTIYNFDHCPTEKEFKNHKT